MNKQYKLFEKKSIFISKRVEIRRATDIAALLLWLLKHLNTLSSKLAENDAQVYPVPCCMK